MFGLLTKLVSYNNFSKQRSCLKIEQKFKLQANKQEVLREKIERINIFLLNQIFTNY